MKKIKKVKSSSKKVKALILFSGGLDSRLVVKILQDQGIETELVYFNFPFGCGCCNNLSCNFNFSQINSAKLHILDCTKGVLFKKYLEIVKDPKYGYGRALNPCISCRIFMLKEAKKLMKKLSCEFIATGEVLGQRPMSQYKQAMINIEKESKLVGKILRPLSAKLLEETKMEKEKLVDRSKLLAINGRKRNIQMELAKKFNITYPSPAGGCLLCDKLYSIKLKDLLKSNLSPSPEEIETLNGFRHFRNKGKIILGKNEKENFKLVELNKVLRYFCIVSSTSSPGPTAIYENQEDKPLVEDMIKVYAGKEIKEREKFNKFNLIKKE